MKIKNKQYYLKNVLIKNKIYNVFHHIIYVTIKNLVLK